MTKEKIIQQGAEAILILRDDEIIKRRVKKGYRIGEMDDSIRQRRTKKEGRLLEKAGKIIRVPKVKKVDDKKMEIEMDFVEGSKLSECLDGLKNWREVCIEIGKNIGRLHNGGIIHGDLTTSNMILSCGEVWFIDFGLGFGNGKIEDKAVDLHLIKQALEAKHFLNFEELFKAVLDGYKNSRDSEEVLKRMKKVEMRGRYKMQY